MSSSVIPPKVIWAQDKNKVFVTFCLEDCPKPVIKVEEKKVFFSGESNGSTYEVSMDLFSELDPKETSKLLLDRVIEVTLSKADKTSSYWPRLLSDKRKNHWLSVDFKKWKDESDDDSSPEDSDQMMTGVNDMFQGRVPVIPNNMGSNHQFSLDDLEDDEEDEDEDEAPLPEATSKN